MENDPAAAGPLERLREGNRRFVEAIGSATNAPEIRASLADAAPYAVVLGCSDSRVPPEIVFDETIGRLFVVRVAANVAGAEEIGSIEYALGRWGCPVLVVLGHTQCGGVAAAMDRLPPGAEAVSDPWGSMNLGALVSAVRSNLGWTPDAGSADPWADAVRLNVLRTLERLASLSQPVRELVEDDRLELVGAVYHVETGEVEFLEAADN